MTCRAGARVTGRRALSIAALERRGRRACREREHGPLERAVRRSSWRISVVFTAGQLNASLIKIAANICLSNGASQLCYIWRVNRRNGVFTGLLPPLLCDKRNSRSRDPGVRIDQFGERRELRGGRSRRGSGPRSRRARRPRRRSACRRGTGAASARIRAPARAAASAPSAPGGGARAPRATRACAGITSAPTASMTCSAWPSTTAIVAWMRSTSTRRSRPITSVTSSPRRTDVDPARAGRPRSGCAPPSRCRS